MKDKKRPTIGFLIPNLLGEYYEIQWFSLHQSAKELDVNLIIFSPFMFLSNISNKEECIKTFQFVNENDIDGVIVSSGAMRGYFDADEVERLCNAFTGIPVVSLSEKFKGIPSVRIDNKQGMRDLIEHFVKDHDYKKIAFIKGTRNNHEAELRYSAYLEILKKYEIPFDEKLIFQGDFGLHSGERAVMEFLDKRKVEVDAIVAANDDMILGAFSELQTRGIKVPDEIALGGFDNIKAVKEVDPPISTVQQPFDEQVQKALQMIMAQVEGRESKQNVIFPARPVIRTSCGCTHTTPQFAPDSEEYKYYKYSKIKDDKQKYDNTQQGYNVGFITEFSTAIMNALSFNIIKTQLADLMPKVAITTCYIYFYKDKQPLFMKEDKIPPDESILFYAYKDMVRIKKEEKIQCYKTGKIIPDSGYFNKGRHTLVFTEFIFQNEHHGFVCLEMPKINPLVINLFKSQFTNCLHNIYIHSKLEQAYKKLKEFDKAKTEFFVNISHEFRTPLTLLLGPIESILKGDFGDHYRKERGIFQSMLANGTQLLNLISNLLDFSKIEAGHMVLRKQRTNITDMLRKYVDSIKATANVKGLFISFKDEAEKDITTFVDKGLLEKAIFNLMSNALKFTPEKGSINVQLGANKKEYSIIVTDTGIGIPENQHENIFDRFTQVDGSISRKYSGTGIGLAFTKEIVELHGGSIKVASTEGEGSAFTITLPFEYLTDYKKAVSGDNDEFGENEISSLQSMTAYYSAEEQEEEEPEPDLKSGKKIILLVEDNKGMRIFIKKLLNEDYTVISGKNGKEGYELANIYLPDIILSDIMMPEVNGYQLTNMIKKNPSLLHTPIILISAKTDILEKIEGFDMGADDYLTKPFNADELRARIRSQLTMKALRDKLVQERDTLIKAIKERKKLKIEKEAAVKANKIKNEFLANVSHEIRTPISAIIGFTELLLKTEPDSMNRKKLDIIQESGNHLLGLVNDILDFSKISVDKIELFYTSFSLKDMINNIFHMFYIKSKEKKLKFNLFVADDVPEFVYGDKKRIRQIVLNLLSNAFKFTKAGKIEIELKYRTGSAYFCISDTGIGIKKQIQANIFNAFSQADASTTREYGGIGLGLAITKKLTEKMNGNITLKSKLGYGSTFIVELPLPKSEKNAEQMPTGGYENKTAGLMATTNSSEPRNPSYIKILVVEKKKGRQLIFTNLLEALNLDFTITEESSNIINVLKKEGYTVLLLDMDIKGVHGVEIINAIRSDKRLKNLYAIAFSPIDSKEDLELYLEAGYDEYISEQIDLARFKQRLDKLLSDAKNISADPEDKIPPVNKKFDLHIKKGYKPQVKKIIFQLRKNCHLFNSREVEVLSKQLNLLLEGKDRGTIKKNLEEAAQFYDDNLLIETLFILEEL